MVSMTLAARGVPDPYQIYDNARTFWQAQRYPDRLDYTIVVRVTQDGQSKEERYGGTFDATTGVADVDPTSDYERDHKPTGSGVKLCLPFHCLTPPTTAGLDYLGVPKIGPVYFFGITRYTPHAANAPDDMALVKQIRDEFHDPNPHPTPIPSQDPRTPIATVVAHNREYSITLAGEEEVNGVECYHLGMKPLRDPGQYRLRDLWIDEKTFATVRANIALNFVSGPGTTMPWTIDFDDVDGRHYVRSERAHGTWTHYRRTYDNVEIRFEDIRQTTPHSNYGHEFSAPDVLVEPS